MCKLTWAASLLNVPYGNSFLSLVINHCKSCREIIDKTSLPTPNFKVLEVLRSRGGSHLRWNRLKNLWSTLSAPVLHWMIGGRQKSGPRKKFSLIKEWEALHQKAYFDIYRQIWWDLLVSSSSQKAQGELIAQEHLIAPICFCSCLASPQTDLGNTLLLFCHCCTAQMA